MKNPSLLQSTIAQKCPSCRQAPLFKTGPYNLKTFDQIHQYCPHCGHDNEPEPGFYMGAMYVSYAIQVVLIVAMVIAAKLFHIEIELEWFIAGVAALVVVLLPINYRLSRSVWAHMFIPFREVDEKQVEG